MPRLGGVGAWEKVETPCFRLLDLALPIKCMKINESARTERGKKLFCDRAFDTRILESYGNYAIFGIKEISWDLM